MHDILEYYQTLWQGMDRGLVPIAVAFYIVVWGVTLYYAFTWSKKMMGKIKMRRKLQLTKDVCEIIEDKFVDGLTEAIDSKRLNLEDARQLYARLAHLGFWGLHPRKFTPKKTREDLDELKAKLKAQRTARSNSNGKTTTSIVDKLLDGVTAELA